MTENKEYDLEFGKFIKENRRKKKMTQKTVAEQLGIAQSYYSRMEHGVRSVDLKMAAKICNVLGINLQDFKYAADYKTGSLIDITTENRAGTSIGEMLTLPPISEITAAPFGLRASNNSSTRGNP